MKKNKIKVAKVRAYRAKGENRVEVIIKNKDLQEIEYSKIGSAERNMLDISAIADKLLLKIYRKEDSAKSSYKIKSITTDNKLWSKEDIRQLVQEVRRTLKVLYERYCLNISYESTVTINKGVDNAK